MSVPPLCREGLAGGHTYFGVKFLLAGNILERLLGDEVQYYLRHGDGCGLNMMVEEHEQSKILVSVVGLIMVDESTTTGGGLLS